MKYTYRHKKFTAVFTDKDGYFSLTGNVNGGSGACGDTIAKIDPRFKLMESMHLCDAKTGEPMHAEANAMYFAEEFLEQTGKYSIETIMNHLHLSEEKAKTFCELVAGRKAEMKGMLSISRPSEAAQIKLKMFFTELKKQWAQEAEDVVKQAQELYDEYEDENEADDDGPFDWDGCNEPAKVKALSEWLDCNPSDVEEFGYYDRYEAQAHGRTYLVVDDAEADDLWDDYLESYIDDCLEIPKQMKNYFDRDAWKSDARMDGRGHSLSGYDGEEHDVTVEYEGESLTYYIYRQ